MVKPNGYREPMAINVANVGTIGSKDGVRSHVTRIAVGRMEQRPIDMKNRVAQTMALYNERGFSFFLNTRIIQAKTCSRKMRS